MPGWMLFLRDKDGTERRQAKYFSLDYFIKICYNCLLNEVFKKCHLCNCFKKDYLTRINTDYRTN